MMNNEQVATVFRLLLVLELTSIQMVLSCELYILTSLHYN